MLGSGETLLVSGATGLVGRRWLGALEGSGATVRGLTRRPQQAGLPGGAEAVGWNGLDVPPQVLAGATVVVHLAGEPIFGGLPSAGRRDRMHASRVLSTESLVAGIGQLTASLRPRVLVCASAVGIYAGRGEEILEENAEPGSGFLAKLCLDWEAAARRAEQHGVRVVSLRTGLVLAREGGVLAGLRPLFRLGLGGRVGSGRQWMPWIQVDDLGRLIEAVAMDESVRGPVNAVAPGIVRNREFTAALAAQLGRPALLRIPGLALRAALRDLAGEMLDSRRVVPARALAMGFRFEHAELGTALAAELGPRT